MLGIFVRNCTSGEFWIGWRQQENWKMARRKCESRRHEHEVNNTPVTPSRYKTEKREETEFSQQWREREKSRPNILICNVKFLEMNGFQEGFISENVVVRFYLQTLVYFLCHTAHVTFIDVFELLNQWPHIQTNGCFPKTIKVENEVIKKRGAAS